MPNVPCASEFGKRFSTATLLHTPTSAIRHAGYTPALYKTHLDCTNVCSMSMNITRLLLAWSWTSTGFLASSSTPNPPHSPPSRRSLSRPAPLAVPQVITRSLNTSICWGVPTCIIKQRLERHVTRLEKATEITGRLRSS